MSQYADQIRAAADASTEVVVQDAIDAAVEEAKTPLQDDLDAAHAEVARLTESLEDADADIAILQANLDAANAKIAELEAVIEDLESQQPEPSVPFEHGVTMPDKDNVGAGIAPFKIPTEVISNNGQPITYTSTQTIENKVFECFPRAKGKDVVVTLRNCIIIGPATAPTAGGGVVQTTFDDNAHFILEFCDVHPQVPSAYLGCIAYRNYTVIRCNLWHGTDIFAAFSKAGTTGELARANIKIIDSWAHDMSRFAPDYATNNRPETHNDIIQLQGNIGPVDDILISGSRFDAYHATDVGTQPVVHTQISAVVATPNTQNQVNVTIEKSWMSGGIFTANFGVDTLANSTVKIVDTVFEKPSSGKVAAAIATDKRLVNKTISGNTYPDGTAVVPYANA